MKTLLKYILFLGGLFSQLHGMNLQNIPFFDATTYKANPQIRFYQPSDKLAAGYILTENGLGGVYTFEEYENYCHTREWAGRKIIVYEYENTIVGVCLYCVTPEYNNAGYIATLAIHPQYQHMGFGSALIKQALYNLSCMNSKNVILDSLTSAEGFYKKFGFSQLCDGTFFILL